LGVGFAPIAVNLAYGPQAEVTVRLILSGHLAVRRDLLRGGRSVLLSQVSQDVGLQDVAQVH
jgi:hypothetical protein